MPNQPRQSLLEGSENTSGYMSFPRTKKTGKTCLVIRYGALGDALFATPVLRLLKEQGYYIVYNCTEYSAQVLRENPYVDEFFFQGKDVIPNEELGSYWKEIGQDFDRVINLSQSIEGTLLKIEGSEAFKWPHNKRHRECNVNYMDNTMRIAGFPEEKGLLPELHFSEMEEYLAKVFREKYKDNFLIEVSLSGSSFHKTYPWMPFVIGEIHKNYDDVRVITVGDYLCKLLESWQHPNTINKAGVFTVRQSMILTKYADLVLGSETGILNAASCFETPKMVLLSHSSVENLTKYWKNCTSLHAKSCNCYPCHRLIYTLNNTCPLEKIKIPDGNDLFEIEVPACMSKIRPEDVYLAFEHYYRIWQESRNTNLIKEQKNGKVR